MELLQFFFYFRFCGMSELDVNAAFRLLRPVCVLVSQNHDVKSIADLEALLTGGTLSYAVLQEMHEYVAFPLRLVLKQYAVR